MAWYRLSGLHSIDKLNWKNIENKPGVYLFYRVWNGPCSYIGRSGSNLRQQITGHPYNYFRYKHTYSEKGAYYWECEYYHRYIDTIDNINHPAKPPGYPDSKCHVCGL